MFTMLAAVLLARTLLAEILSVLLTYCAFLAYCMLDASFFIIVLLLLLFTIPSLCMLVF